ncbi:CHAT domain-containing protein [Streptomyces sp. NPDC001002]
MRFGRRRHLPTTAHEAMRAAAEENRAWAAGASWRGLDIAYTGHALTDTDPQAAADASWHQLTGLAQAFDARTRSASRADLLRAEEGLAAETAWHQNRAGRPWQAARALECGRALLLGRMVGGIGPTATAALRTLGQEALLAEYLDAQGALADLLRAQADCDAPPAPPPVVLGGASFAVRTGDPLVAAYARLRGIEARLAAGVLGGADDAGFLGPVPTVESLRRTARLCGPLVYLAAAQAGGLAVVIGAEEHPVAVELPALTRRDTGLLSEALRTARSSGLLARPLVPALSDLTDSLRAVPLPPSGAGTVTVVGAGPMSLLPLTTALGQAFRDRDPGGASVPAVRHAPSARTLLHAGRPADGGSAAGSGRLLIAAVPTAAEYGGRRMPDLRWADRQAAALTRLHGPERVLPVTRTVADVLRLLPQADILHFHCHGHADSADPLNSALLLADRALTVRDLLAVDGLRGRLVILGACESAATSGPLPDEAIGFPGVLLQAGARCVVASLWKTREDAAALLLHRLHVELLRPGRTPPGALAAAQTWLRTSTPDQRAADCPDLTPRAHRLAPAHFTSPEHWAGWTCTAG